MAKAGPLLEPIIPRRRRWSKCQLVDDEQCKWLRWAISDGRRSIHWSVRDENVNYLLVERHPFVFWLPVRMGLYRTVSGGIEACGICHIRRSAINPSMANGTHPPVATNNNIFLSTCRCASNHGLIDLCLNIRSTPFKFACATSRHEHVMQPQNEWKMISCFSPCGRCDWPAHRRMWTVTNYFLVNLSISDLLLAVLNCVFNFVYMLNNDWRKRITWLCDDILD